MAAELNRRGVYASPWAGNLPGIDIVAMDGAKEKTEILLSSLALSNEIAVPAHHV